MGFRFRRSVKIMPGVRMNIGKRGASVSVGPRGAKLTAGTSGVRATAGAPGTGLSYTKKLGAGTCKRSAASSNSLAENVSITVSIEDNGQVNFLANGEVLPPKLKKMAIEQHGEKIQQLLEDHATELNQGIEETLTLHLKTPAPTQQRSFSLKSFSMKKPKAPVLKKPSFFVKLIKSKLEALEAENYILKKKYQKACEHWTQERIDHEQSEEARRKTFEDRLADIAQMQNYLEEIFQTIKFPRETFVAFEIDESKVMVDVDLPEIEDMPVKQATIAKSGLKLNIKDRSDTQRRKEYMQHIHAVGFRVIGETFAALPNITKVVCSAYSQRAESATGRINDEYLYSVKVTRSDWSNLNFTNLEAIDLPDCFGTFEIRRKMTKTGVFKPVEPFSS